MNATSIDGTTPATPARPRRSRRRQAAFLALAAAVVLPGLACGDDDDTSTSAGEAGGDMTVSIAEPTGGAAVGRSFEVAVDSSVPLGEPDTGRHHIHLYYDGNTADGEYDIVYGSSATVERLDPGEHTIEAVIANGDHSLTDARDEITVTVGDDAGASGGGATTSTTSDGTTTETDDDGDDDSGYGY
jgi:hypothetical protein